MDDSLVSSVKSIARHAGELILDVYNSDQRTQMTEKLDNTPVTAADLRAHDYIYQALSTLPIIYPVLSEEAELVDYQQRQSWDCYWLVDPLDGTKEFIHGTDEFVVSIALIKNHLPVLGVLYSPVDQIMYYAAKNSGAFKELITGEIKKINVNQHIKDPIQVAISRRHYSQDMFDYLGALGRIEMMRMGSALKFGLVAEGKIDLYPCFGRTCEWDTAAGQCIIEEAGGVVLDVTGSPLHYNTKPEIYNPPFIATCDSHYPWLTYFEKSDGSNENESKSE